MKSKISLPFQCLSVFLASLMAPPQPDLIPKVVVGTLVGLSSLAKVSAREIRDMMPLAGSKSAAPLSLPAVKFSSNPTDAELSAARVFDEPLVPLNAEADARENLALSQALTAYGRRATTDDCSSLAQFADDFPHSRWTASLLLHLGTEYYNDGYFSKALEAWQRAWTQFQGCQYVGAKPQADRALGELAQMYARIGRAAELSALLDSAGERDLGGPGARLVHASREALWMMLHKPDYDFGCGPSALDRILLRFSPSKAGNPVLWECKSGTNGFALSQVAEISRKLGMNYEMAYRQPGAPLILPSVVHWKVGHYAALIERRDERVLVQDYTFAASLWVSDQALNEETSGYYLVPPGGLPAGWRAVSAAEGQTVWGKGLTQTEDNNANSGHDTTCGGSSCTTCRPCQQGSGGMATYTMHALLTSLTLQDTPVQFSSPVGPQVAFTATYNQAEADQPATFSYSNLGPLWNCSFLSYVTDNPQSPNANVALYELGGGTLPIYNYNPATQTFAPEAMSQGILIRLTGAGYEIRYPDGSRREYAQSDGSVGTTRRIFLTQMIDPVGNVLQFNYDLQLRITNVVNAIGQAMTLSYTNLAYPFAITAVTDPFGRAAQFQYNTNGLLAQITDVLGLTSQFSYGTNQFVRALTTPYGTTTFTTGTTNIGGGPANYLTATDPLGGTELVVYTQSMPVPTSLDDADMPHGLSTFNLYMQARDSFYWNKKAYAEGAWDWTKAHIYHWLHSTPNGEQSARILESEKDPLASRIWYNYPGQATNDGAPYYLDAAYTGASAQPSIVARVLDDSTTQLSTYGYNTAGNVTNATDPLGRNFTYVYASNNVDLLETRMTHNGKNELLASVAYNSQHLPVSTTDASGQTTINTYNLRGQILTSTNPRHETTTFSYDGNGFLIAIQGPLAGTNDMAYFTYDAYNRIYTATDTEGYTNTFTYDAFDRPISVSYPDGSTVQMVYDRLDLAAVKDRLGRWTTNTYDANRQLVSTLDPLGRLTRYEYCKCGLLESVIDPLGRKTSWMYDLQSRPTAKQYADGSMDTQAYDTASGRLHAKTAANGNQTIFEYNGDDTVKTVSYHGGTNATPPVSFTYDSDYPRVLTMQDGIGTTTYTYNAITRIPTLGAGRLQSVSGPLPNSRVTYQYDELGRTVSRAINGVAQSASYDVLGRTIGMTNNLGAFQYSYVNATARLSVESYPNGQTNLYSYYDNPGDQRLRQVTRLYPNGSLLSSSSYSYNTAGDVTGSTNQWDSLPTRVWLAGYDAADQLTNVKCAGGPSAVTNYTYAYDPAGNRTLAQSNSAAVPSQYNSLNELTSGGSDATNGVTYEWDAAQRLVAINSGTHRSEFSYDGFGRRVRQVEKDNGVVSSDHYFVWLGAGLGEERDASGANVVRRFYQQGEAIVSGGGSTNLFYTRDQLGSVRDVLDMSGTLQARYDYDPYGQQTILAETVASSFAFSGHFQHRPSGLYLTLYRALDAAAGRWLSRDPVGGIILNAYDYVGNNPLGEIDPYGNFPWAAALLGVGAVVLAIAAAPVIAAAAGVSTGVVAAGIIASGVVSGAANYYQAGKGRTWKDFYAGAVGGVIGGVISSIPVPFFPGVAGGVVSQVVTQITSNSLEGNCLTKDLGAAAKAGLAGGVIGGFLGLGASAITDQLVSQGVRAAVATGFAQTVAAVAPSVAANGVQIFSSNWR